MEKETKIKIASGSVMVPDSELESRIRWMLSGCPVQNEHFPTLVRIAEAFATLPDSPHGRASALAARAVQMAPLIRRLQEIGGKEAIAALLANLAKEHHLREEDREERGFFRNWRKCIAEFGKRIRASGTAE